MNDDAPLNHGKRSAAGALLRIDLLRSQGIELGDLNSAASAPLDDVLDAAAAAWSAHRIARRLARTLPEQPEIVDGRPVGIWF
jgi:predicted RNase H-like nuclease